MACADTTHWCRRRVQLDICGLRECEEDPLYMPAPLDHRPGPTHRQPARTLARCSPTNGRPGPAARSRRPEAVPANVQARLQRGGSDSTSPHSPDVSPHQAAPSTLVTPQTPVGQTSATPTKPASVSTLWLEKGLYSPATMLLSSSITRRTNVTRRVRSSQQIHGVLHLPRPRTQLPQPRIRR